jgi:hypothetical protein
MSYAVESSTAVAAPRSRPVPVTLAAALLVVMGVAGLAYAVTTLAVTPGVVARFQATAAGADPADVDGFVTVLWVAAAVAAVLAIILVALYVVLALALRRGSNAARIGAWVVSALGLSAGLGSTVAVLVERRGVNAPGTLGTALVDAYPSGWIGLNIAVAVAQIVGYVLVAVLLAISPGAFFRRTVPTAQPGYVAGPGYAWPSDRGTP